MVDIATISSAVSSLDNIIGLVKSMREAKKSFDKATFEIQLTGLLNELADQKMILADLKNIMLAKDDEIASLNNKIKNFYSGEKPIFKNGCYRFTSDDGNYCARCWDDAMKKFHVVRTNNPGMWECIQCKAAFSPLT